MDTADGVPAEAAAAAPETDASAASTSGREAEAGPSATTPSSGAGDPAAAGIVAGLSAADLPGEEMTATPRTVIVEINHMPQEVKVDPGKVDAEDVCVLVATHAAHGSEIKSITHRVRRHSVSTVGHGLPAMPGTAIADSLSEGGGPADDGDAGRGGESDKDEDARLHAARGAVKSGGSGSPDEESAALTFLQQLSINLSFAINILLAVIKLIAAVASGSIVVIASALDSVLDVMSGCIIFFTQRAITKRDLARYPVGKTRLAPVGIIVFASVMGTSTATIVLESLKGLAEGQGEPLDLQPFVIVILLLTIVFKGGLFILCQCSGKDSSSVNALAEDHRNDLLSNVVAVVAAWVAAEFPTDAWWLDGVGAIIVGVYIIVVWVYTGWEEVRKLAGYAAEPADIQEILDVAVNWHPMMEVDKIRAYHHGEFYLCELEIVLPREMTVEDSHHIGLALQQRIERFRLVERCFVHIDYKKRPHEEHYDPATGEHGTFEA